MEQKKENISSQPDHRPGLPVPKTHPNENGPSGSRYNAKAYSEPPGGGVSTGAGRLRSKRTWTGVGAALLLAGVMGSAFYFYHPSSPVANQVTSTVTQKGVLRVSAGDVNVEATLIATQLIASGKLPPAPKEPPPVSAAAPGPPPISATPATASAPSGTSAPETPAPKAPPIRPKVAHPKTRPASAAPAGAGDLAAAQQAAQPPSAAPPADTPAPPKTHGELEQEVLAILARAPESTRAALAAGQQKLYTLHIYDNMAEDGDAIEVFVNGASYGEITLLHQGIDLTIPLPGDTTASVHVVATKDGGGGVTYAMHSTAGEARSRVMAVGESDDWTVTW